MSRSKAKVEPVEATEELAPTFEDVESALDEVGQVFDEQNFADFVRDLVKNFVGHEVQELNQRITDLETLVGQPQDAVQFVTPPVAPLWSNDQKQHPGKSGDVPWYQPNY
jgi:hypothetical protein